MQYYADGNPIALEHVRNNTGRPEPVPTGNCSPWGNCRPCNGFGYVNEPQDEHGRSILARCERCNGTGWNPR